VVRTRFAAEDPAWKAFLALIRPFLKTPQKGAATSIYLASSPEVEGVTGIYSDRLGALRVCWAGSGGGAGHEGLRGWVQAGLLGLADPGAARPTAVAAARAVSTMPRGRGSRPRDHRCTPRESSCPRGIVGP
jgi:hypothetical protein